MGEMREEGSNHPVAYPGGFLVAQKPPPPGHDFFKSRGDTLTGTDLHQPLKFATFRNPPETNSGYATATHQLKAPVWPEVEGSQEGGGQSTEECGGRTLPKA